MKPGDLLKQTRMNKRGIVRTSQFRVLGILLEEPKFPSYGIYPLYYRILTTEGIVEDITDKFGYRIEVIEP